MSSLATAAKMSIRVDRMRDQQLIASTLSHPRIFPRISDDGCRFARDLPMPDVDGPCIFIGAFDQDEYLGLFMLHAHNLVLFEVHTCLLPSAWGDRALAAAVACIRWTFDNTSCRRLITSVPDDNPLALRLAIRAGMEAYGRNPKSMQRAGLLRDLIMLGISKE